jgi:hypothetical protein
MESNQQAIAAIKTTQNIPLWPKEETEGNNI